jgi:hypothetical protein
MRSSSETKPSMARRWLQRLAAVLLLSGVVPLIEAGPAAATSWSVSLSVNASDVAVGETVTLTATVNQSLTETPYFLDVYDQTTGTPLGFCGTGTSCELEHSEAQAGSHTFIAYVDNDPVFHYPPCCVVATSNTVEVRWHARATAAFNVQFTVSGTLPEFPCSGCGAGISGTGTGEGKGHASSSDGVYDATFVMSQGWASGHADYTEPRHPVCPGLGSAAGTVVLSGGAVGTVHRTSTPTAVGTVNDAVFTLEYSYQRIGATSAIVINGGTARIYVSFPDTGPDYFIANVVGAGPGAFIADPLLVEQRCQSPGPLPFTVLGDVALTLT